MLTTSARDAILNTFDSHYVGWLSAITDYRAGTVTELSYAGYARAAITFGSPATTSPAGGRQRANSSACTGGQKTDAGSVNAIGWGIYSASTAGTLKWIGLLDSDVPIVGTADTGDLITAPAHGLSTDQRVFVLAAPGAVLPAGLAENTAYFVLASGLTTDAFKLSTTSGGSAVDVTASGAAMFIPYTALAIAQNATPEFASAALVIQI
jgi:hypothetical protein